MLNYDAILFDVDGTLIDSAPGIINTLKEVFARMGVDTTNVNLRRYLGPPLRKSFAFVSILFASAVDFPITLGTTASFAEFSSV